MRFLTLIFLVVLGALPAMAGRLTDLFANPKPIIGVVNVTALPGQKGFVSMEQAEKEALDQVQILEEEGVDAVLFENLEGDFESTPEMTAGMTVIVASAVKRFKKITVGVEILWHDPKASLAIAKASGAKFIRTDFWVDKMKAGDRIVEEDPKKILDYQKSIGAEDVLILTDIQVKYAEMIDKTKTIETSALEAKNNGSDGVVVSGPKSGVPADIEKVKRAKQGANGLEVVLGSGTSSLNVKELLSIADAAIVGTSISTKTGGTVIRAKVRDYMDVVNTLRAEIKAATPSP